MKTKIICIDLTMYNQSKLKELADLNGLSYDFLLKNKLADCAKIWIDLENDCLVAFTTKKIKTIMYTDIYKTVLESIAPIEAPKKVSVLEVDTILEKIKNYGISSLTNEEKLFLDNESRK